MTAPLSARPGVKALEWREEHGMASMGPYRLFQATTPLGCYSYGTDAEGACYWHGASTGVFMVADEATAKRQAEMAWEKAALTEAGKFVVLFALSEPEQQEAVAAIVPEHCTGTSLVFVEGILHVKKDGSGSIVVREEHFQIETEYDDEDGSRSDFWITHFPPGEMQALKDFLNGVKFVPQSDKTAALEAANRRATFDAMCAMRNSINEVIPMPSLESDLLQGPEDSVFCATVAETVVGRVKTLEAEIAELRESNLDLAASLAAAISLLERTPKAKKAAPSDRMFDQMLVDYRASLERFRALIKDHPHAE